MTLSAAAVPCASGTLPAPVVAEAQRSGATPVGSCPVADVNDPVGQARSRAGLQQDRHWDCSSGAWMQRRHRAPA
jgi:hypothetical protein